MQLSCSLIQIPEHLVLASVYNRFDLSHRHIKFLGERLITNSVYQTAFQYPSVSLTVYMLIYQPGNLTVGIFDHLILTLPVPWQILHLRYPELPPVLRRLIRIVCFAIRYISVSADIIIVTV